MFYLFMLIFVLARTQLGRFSGFFNKRKKTCVPGFNQETTYFNFNPTDLLARLLLNFWMFNSWTVCARWSRDDDTRPVYSCAIHNICGHSRPAEQRILWIGKPSQVGTPNWLFFFLVNKRVERRRCRLYFCIFNSSAFFSSLCARHKFNAFVGLYSEVFVPNLSQILWRTRFIPRQTQQLCISWLRTRSQQTKSSTRKLKSFFLIVAHPATTSLFCNAQQSGKQPLCGFLSEFTQLLLRRQSTVSASTQNLQHIRISNQIQG